jgi:hypothetical protein
MLVIKYVVQFAVRDMSLGECPAVSLPRGISTNRPDALAFVMVTASTRSR